MNPNKSTSAIRLLTFGLLISLFWVGVAQAAPVYQGRFTLPHAVHWGKAVLPAGDYQLRLEDIAKTRAFVIQDLRQHRDVAFVPAIAVDEAQGKSALLIVNDENQWVVQSLTVGELGKAFICEPRLVRRTKGIEEARTIETLPVTQAKNW